MFLNLLGVNAGISIGNGVVMDAINTTGVWLAEQNQIIRILACSAGNDGTTTAGGAGGEIIDVYMPVKKGDTLNISTIGTGNTVLSGIINATLVKGAGAAGGAVTYGGSGSWTGNPGVDTAYAMGGSGNGACSTSNQNPFGSGGGGGAGIGSGGCTGFYNPSGNSWQSGPGRVPLITPSRFDIISDTYPPMSCTTKIVTPAASIAAAAFGGPGLGSYIPDGANPIGNTGGIANSWGGAGGNGSMTDASSNPIGGGGAGSLCGGGSVYTLTHATGVCGGGGGGVGAGGGGNNAGASYCGKGGKGAVFIYRQL